MTDRPESPGDDAVELASRYLDGDLSVDERAAAESDPDVMAWVERFGGMRAALLEPIEVDAAQRTAAVAAALAAADVAAPEAAPPPGRDELAAARARRAGRMGKWLGAAAAVAALAIGGAVLAGNSGGSDDDSADGDVMMSAADEVGPASTEADSKQLTDEEASTEAPNAAMSATESAQANDSAASTVVSGEVTSSEPTERDEGPSDAAGTTAAGAATTTAPSAAGPLSFDTATDLRILEDAESITMPEGREPPCLDQAIGELVALEVFYADQPAAVYRDSQRRTLTAWAVDSCVVLAEYIYPAD